MNVSSLVVKIEPKNMDAALSSLAVTGLCEIHFQDPGKGTIVVTIEGKDVGEEMEKMKAIERIPHVLSAALVYAYSENELEKARQQLAGSGRAVPDALKEQ